jgi:hypothetical protein
LCKAGEGEAEQNQGCRNATGLGVHGPSQAAIFAPSFDFVLATGGPVSREEDSWLSKAQHAALRRADEVDPLGSPVPTRVVSNGEYFPMPQTLQQREVEARIAELAGETARRLGMTRRRFLASSAGMATAFVAMNEVYGRFFDVDPLEMLGRAHAQGNVRGPRLDDQLHMIRETMMGPPPTRAVAGRGRCGEPRARQIRSTPKACPTSSAGRGRRGTRRWGRARSTARTSSW